MNRKIDRERPELHPVAVKSPWYHLGIDFIGPIFPVSRSGNRFILTVSDYFTKFAYACSPYKGSEWGCSILETCLFCYYPHHIL